MTAIPLKSIISAHVNDSYFSDSFSSVISYENQSALDIFLHLYKNTPHWVKRLMTLRNWIVSRLGLKKSGNFSAIDAPRSNSNFNVGGKIGIFSLYSNSYNEVIVENRDKHLNVKISLYVVPNGKTAKVYLSTVVHVNNIWGKVYMFFVGPVHKVIVPAMLKTLPRV